MVTVIRISFQHMCYSSRNPVFWSFCFLHWVLSLVANSDWIWRALKSGPCKRCWRDKRKDWEQVSRGTRDFGFLLIAVSIKFMEFLLFISTKTLRKQLSEELTLKLTRNSLPKYMGKNDHCGPRCNYN